MSPVSILLIGLAMSTDAFAAAIGKGAAMRRPRLRDALRVGLVFATIEAVTPLLGWLLGRAATRYVAAYDHWIAFGLLGALGVHMIVAGCRAAPDAEVEAGDAEEARRGSGSSLLALAATGVATSIDALAVGVSLAFLNVPIIVVAAVIGSCTLVMVTLGVLLGRALGRLVGRRAEILGGLILILIGVVILYEHLGGAA